MRAFRDLGSLLHDESFHDRSPSRGVAPGAGCRRIGSGSGTGGFYWNRLARIAPLYYLMLVLTYIFGWSMSPDELNTENFVWHLFFAQGFSGGYHVMLFDLRKPLVAGQTVPLTLVIEETGKRAYRMAVSAVVRAGGH